jgi:hypothetical protein
MKGAIRVEHLPAGGPDGLIRVSQPKVVGVHELNRILSRRHHLQPALD